ncbi:MAG: hypothetical protein JWQ29_1875 [Phenylobacterium sp.]|nr:hypothetical protein [Phenylobacterium sp.]
MTCMTIEITKEPEGWFVTGRDSIGPFFSRQRATDLAEGMVAAIRASGQDVRLVAHDRPAPSGDLGTGAGNTP